MAAGDTLVNALVGALVTTVLSFTALSPVAGGAVAAYLQRGDRSTGLRVGAISGVIATVPVFVAVAVVALFVLSLGGPDGSSTAVASFGIVALVAFALVLAWTVGLSALGGLLGWYLADERTTEPIRGV